MAIIYQLDLFESPHTTELKAVERIVVALKESQDKVRKGTYARLNEQGKDIKMVIERLDLLERHICKGSNE